MNKYISWSLWISSALCLAYFIINLIETGNLYQTIDNLLLGVLLGCYSFVGFIFCIMFLPPVWIYLCWYFFVKKGNNK